MFKNKALSDGDISVNLTYAASLFAEYTEPPCPHHRIYFIGIYRPQDRNTTLVHRGLLTF